MENNNLMVIHMSSLDGASAGNFTLECIAKFMNDTSEMTCLQESIPVTEEDGRVELFWLKR